MLFLNLFRDQLDRYGEVDSVAEGWREMLVADASGLTLVLNADDPSIAQLEDGARGEVVLFGVEDRAAALSGTDGVHGDGAEHAADARFCGCGAPFRYEAVFLGHVGIWRCDGCGRTRPRPQVAAHAIYAVYNALGAAAAAHAIGIAGSVIAAALGEAAPAFGRQETFAIEGRMLRLWLAKNPVGLNAVLRALAGGPAAAEGAPLHLLAALNDGVQDGRDVSWVYDAELELLVGRTASLVVSGDRADDLALRCALAGLCVDAVEPHRASALDQALRRTPAGGRLEVVATYTAMLELRELVATGVGAPPYWQAEASA
jgi:UDP-N-acetylmuramyl tripeptide synthase